MNIASKDPNLHFEIIDMAKNLYGFMKNKFNFDSEPKVHFVSDVENAKNILGKTGHYNPSKEEITVYITNRHGKDILRSLAHELLHHIQGCEGMVKPDQVASTSDQNYIVHDDFLKKVEADAFERGNICFREWEASIKEGSDKMENLEEKKKKKKLSKKKLKIAHKKAKKALKSGGFEKYGERAKEVAYATMTKQALAEGKNEQPVKTEEQKEVVVNDALKNSLYYVKEDRALADAFEKRDEKVYNELLRKFKIKK